MDTENVESQEEEGGVGGSTYITYEIQLQNVEAALDAQEEHLQNLEETQALMLEQQIEINQNIVNQVGVLGALFGFLIGFFVFKELLKVWLE